MSPILRLLGEFELRMGCPELKPPSFVRIPSNIYRTKRPHQHEEAQPCACKPASQGGTDCGPRCLNRLLNIECNRELCACGASCRNCILQDGKVPQTRVVHLGSKGFGLVAVEEVLEGVLVGEYVGEVISTEEAAQRAVSYKASGMPHTYMMSLGAGDVIDATERGGIPRFINHSCQPNCATQKWTVRGILRIGIFALRNIGAGEEITYNYNLEWAGKQQKCECGAQGCTGWLGARSKSFKLASVPGSPASSGSSQVDQHLDNFSSDDEEPTSKPLCSPRMGLGLLSCLQPALNMVLQGACASARCIRISIREYLGNALWASGITVGVPTPQRPC